MQAWRGRALKRQLLGISSPHHLAQLYIWAHINQVHFTRLHRNHRKLYLTLSVEYGMRDKGVEGHQTLWIAALLTTRVGGGWAIMSILHYICA